MRFDATANEKKTDGTNADDYDVYTTTDEAAKNAPEINNDTVNGTYS